MKHTILYQLQYTDTGPTITYIFQTAKQGNVVQRKTQLSTLNPKVTGSNPGSENFFF